MNKRLLIALTAILVIIALMFAFVACNKDGSDEVDPTPDSDELTETAFFTAVREVENPNFDISITDDADTVIYSIDTNGVVYDPFDLDEEGGSFAPSSTSLDYEHDLFSSTSISGQKFVGEIRNPLVFLGIEDESINVSNTKVTIELQGSNNKLKNVKITSNATIGNDGFKLTITVTP